MRKLAVFVGAGNVANRIVDCGEFQEFWQSWILGTYVVPCHTVIDKEVIKVLIDLKGKLSAKIKDASKVSLCVDIWTKRGMTEAFLGITIRSISVARIQSPHKADRIE